jgi:hypothetical protein
MHILFPVQLYFNKLISFIEVIAKDKTLDKCSRNIYCLSAAIVALYLSYVFPP